MLSFVLHNSKLFTGGNLNQEKEVGKHEHTTPYVLGSNIYKRKN